jgi:hypothetical protein
MITSDEGSQMREIGVAVTGSRKDTQKWVAQAVVGVGDSALVGLGMPSVQGLNLAGGDNSGVPGIPCRHPGARELILSGWNTEWSGNSPRNQTDVAQEHSAAFEDQHGCPPWAHAQRHP